MHHHATRAGGQRFGMGLKKNNNFKMSAGSGYDPMNFSASQIPDNPGYMDFSDPTPPPLQQNVKNVVAKKPGQQQRPQQLQHQQPQQQQQQQPSLGTRNSQRNKKAGVKNKPARNNNNNMNNNNNNINNNNSNDMNNTNNNNMNNNNNKRIKRNWPKTKFNGPVGQNNGGGGFKGQNGDGPRVPNRLRGPQNMGGRGRMAPPIPFLPPHAFRTPPLIPPIPHMGRGPLPPPMGVQQLPPPFMRRNARGRPLPMPHPPLPQAMLPPMGRMTRSGGPPHNGGMHFNGGGGLGGKIPKQNIKSIKKVVKGKSSIKTLKNIVNQYPLTKPWVTDEIRAEHAKKVTIEKSLVGNKNDELFAQFKVQRDKFVQLYEAARENHVKTESTNDKPKDAKTQAIVNQTTEPDANCSNAEAIASN